MVFQRGITLICSIEVRDSAGVLTDPATSMTIDIHDPQWQKVVNTASMLPKDSTGKYHYDYITGQTNLIGRYKIFYWATSGSRVSSGEDQFELV